MYQYHTEENKIISFNYFEKFHNIYLIWAITYDSVFLYQLSNELINTLNFNAFYETRSNNAIKINFF